MASTSGTAAQANQFSTSDEKFERICIDHQIYPPPDSEADDKLKPKNMGIILRIMRDLTAPYTPALTRETLQKLQESMLTIRDTTIQTEALPILTGNLDIFHVGHVRFSNLQSMTEDEGTQPRPSFFDGAEYLAVDGRVTDDLDKIILPTSSPRDPVVANFFVEAKGRMGKAYVAMMQAVQDGATGARAIFALQNYGVETPTYDDNAYTLFCRSGSCKLPRVSEARLERLLGQCGRPCCSSGGPMGVDEWRGSGSRDKS